MAVEGKGSQGDGKAQKQPKEQVADQELVVQATEKDIKGEEQKGRRLFLNLQTQEELVSKKVHRGRR